MYVPRTMETFFSKAASQFPVMLVTGARQVGKTTFLRHMSDSDRTYVTLDDPSVLALARMDPALFLQRFPAPLLIDEIQYAPELLPYIKMRSDEARRPGLFWLAGSQQFHLMKGISESLAGRVGIVQLFGLSRREAERRGAESAPFLPTPEEISRRFGPDDIVPLKRLYEILWRGSFPAVALSEAMDRNLFYASYVQTYLQRDVRDLARIGDEMAFLRFLRAAAARSGQLLNMAELARDADVAPNTAKSWLSILEASGIVFLLEPWFSNTTKRLVKAPKLYFLDTGLCSWLTEWNSPEALEAGAASGAILETWVVAEILKTWRHNGRRAPLYFYRDSDRKEIDLLIVQDGIISPVEIKKTASPDRDAVRHFSVLEKLGMPVGPGGVICFAERSLPLTPTTCSIPVGAL